MDVAGEEAAACGDEEEGEEQRDDGLPEPGHMVASPSSSHQSVASMGQASEPYEAPVAFNLSIDDSVYSMRLEWDAPSDGDGTLALLGFNGTLPEATLTLRSPSGAVATLAGGNTSWAAWTGPQTLDEDHLATVLMPDAAPGAWTLWVNRTSPWPGFVYPSVTFDTELAIETESDVQTILGQPTTYRIRPSNAGEAVFDALVTVQLYDPASESVQTILLTDAGLNGDDAAGDGVYSAQHTFTQLGAFSYAASATFAATTLEAEGGVAVRDENETKVMFPPWRPENLSAEVGPAGGQVTLTWQASSFTGGAAVSGYDIYRANETGAQTFLATTGNVSTYTDTDLGSNATHTYTVASRNAIGYSRRSNEANATTFDLPSAPRNLTATPSQAGEIVLAWEAPVDDGGSPVVNYAIYAGIEPGSETPLATVGNVLTYTEVGLDDNVTRHYKVTAVTLAGPGAFSESANATTITVAPSAPRNLTATAGTGAGELTLAWQAPANDGGDAVTGYNVYRGNGTGWSLRASVGPGLGYVDSSLGNDATWHYQVTAINAAGEGVPSNAANATTFDVPTAPQDVVASVGPGAGEITLTWQPPISDGGTPVTNYTVYAGNATGALIELAVLGPVSSYTESSLPDDATRYYAVSATNLAGESPRSNETAAGTFDVPTQSLSLTATPGIGNVTLTWQAPQSDGGAPVTGYDIYRGNASGNLSLYVSVGNVLTYLDDNATPGTRYYYAVSALNIAGEGAASSEVSARPSSLLLTAPSIPLPPLAVPGASVAVAVCDAGSAAGCAVPGASHLCVELRVSSQPAATLACIDHALLPPEVDAALHGLSPIEVGHPGIGTVAWTPEIQVTYLHEAALLNPTLVACAPLHPTAEDVAWLLGNGGETSLTVTLKGAPAPSDAVSIPWLGQVVVAGQALLGVIACG